MTMPRSFAVIPAAGHSRRMGRAKLTLPWRQGTVIERVLAAWKSSPATAIVVVVRPGDELLADICRKSGVDVVIPNEQPAEMKDSISLGLEFVQRRYAPNEQDCWLLAPADMPRLSAAVVSRMIDAYETSPDRAAEIFVPTRGGKRGHPVVFSWSVAAQVANLAADEGVNALLKRNPICEIDCDEFDIHADLDTPADYDRLHGEEQSA